MSLLTTSTHAIPELRDILADRLLESTGLAWTVRQYHGTTAAGLLAAMLATDLPSAVISWSGEETHGEPGRPQRAYNTFHLMLLAEDAQDDGGADVVQEMLDAVKDLLDNYVSGDTVWRYMGAEAVDLSEATDAPNITCVDATIEVGDH